MFEDIMQLIEDKKFEQAKKRISEEEKKLKPIIIKDTLEENIFSPMRRMEQLIDLSRKTTKVELHILYENSNEQLKKDLGKDEYVNTSLMRIVDGFLDQELFQELNPHLDVKQLLLSRGYGKEIWLKKFTELTGEAKTKNGQYIDGLSKIAKVIRDKKLSILMLGESGVGKSYMAKVIHDISDRPGTFIEMNCGNFTSEDRLYQFLFGWERGSHSGAVDDRKGKIDKADKGTLFLDEIDRMPKGTRDALITFIDTKKFQRLGSDVDTKADVRFIFGTNKNLKELISTKEMEKDFYYRINQVSLTIPPLRERKDDFEEIVYAEIKKLNEELDAHITIDSDSIQWLSNFLWPGNYRDLVNYLRKIINFISAEGSTHLSYEFLKENPPDDEPIFLQDEFANFERQLHKYIVEYKQVDKSFVEKEKEKNFLDSFIKPIIAKIYVEDMGDFPKKNNNAMKYTGLSGEQVESSTLYRMYRMYPLLVKKLFNKE